MPKRDNQSANVEAGRHRARRTAMMALYATDLVPRDVEDVVGTWPDEHGFPMPAYAAALVRSVSARRDELDARISERLEGWTIERLGAVERAILRIAVLEMLDRDVPIEVAIDEAVELAKRYASPEAAKLVNGVLGGVIEGDVR